MTADTFGAYGLEGERFLGQLFSRFARRFSNDSETSFPGKPQHDCWQRVAVALRKAVALQLGSAYSQSGGAWVNPFPGDGGEGGGPYPSHPLYASSVLCVSPAFGCNLVFLGPLSGLLVPPPWRWTSRSFTLCSFGGGGGWECS